LSPGFPAGCSPGEDEGEPLDGVPAEVPEKKATWIKATWILENLGELHRLGERQKIVVAVELLPGSCWQKGACPRLLTCRSC
jgi:hypothetical protein